MDHLICDGAVGKLPQIQHILQLYLLPCLCSDHIPILCQNLRHTGANSSISHYCCLNHNPLLPAFLYFSLKIQAYSLANIFT